MGTDKRERKKANRAAKIAEQEAAEAKARRIKAIRNVVLFGVGIVIVAVLLSLTACGADTDTDDAAGNRPDTTDTTATTTGASSPADPDGDETGDPAYGDGECPPVEGVDEPVIDFTIAPQLCIDPARSYTATFATTLGEFTVELDTERTPLTTNNFVVLARFGYFDGTDLFRTEAASGIIQGGSPHTQSNTDPGPGYTIPDEALPFSADDYALGPAYVNDAVTHDAVGGDLGDIEAFAREGLDGVAPQGADGEGHVGIVSRSRWTADRAASRGSVLAKMVHCTIAPSTMTARAAGNHDGALGWSGVARRERCSTRSRL